MIIVVILVVLLVGRAVLELLVTRLNGELNESNMSKTSESILAFFLLAFVVYAVAAVFYVLKTVGTWIFHLLTPEWTLFAVVVIALIAYTGYLIAKLPKESWESQ